MPPTNNCTLIDSDTETLFATVAGAKPILGESATLAASTNWFSPFIFMFSVIYATNDYQPRGP